MTQTTNKQYGDSYMPTSNFISMDIISAKLFHISYIHSLYSVCYIPCNDGI